MIPKPFPILKRYLFLITFLLLVIAGSSRAQIMGGPIGPDSVATAIVPALSYSSNEGLIGGAIYNRINYKGDIRPFRSYLNSTALVSTKGFVEVEGTYEQTRSFGRDIRSIYDVFFRRYTTDIFFGIGNETSFSKNRWEDDYYYFESVSFGLNYKARKPFYQNEKSQLDFLAGVGTEYHIPYSQGDVTSFAQNMPNGSEGGWVNYLNAGLVWENRDSEFDPHHGNRAELEIRFAPDPISTYALTSAKLELRQYFHLFHWLTIANRLETRHVAGDIPFWELSTLGGHSNLRGYPLNRFQGNTSLAYTLEMRGWILKFPQLYNLKLGGHVFTDAGRVFTGSDDFNDLFQGYKQTFGFGGAMSIFNPDLIFRGEIGFSEDVSRIYIGVGYLF